MLGKGWLGQRMGMQEVGEMKWGMAKGWTLQVAEEEWTWTLICSIPDFVYLASVGWDFPTDTENGLILSSAFSSSTAPVLFLRGQNLFHHCCSKSREKFMSTISFTFSSASLMLQLISGTPNTASMERISWKYLVCKWWFRLFAVHHLR